MINVYKRFQMSFFYFLFKKMDKIKGTNLYGADSNDIISKLNTSWYSTAFYPGLLKRIFKYIPKESVSGVLDLGSRKGLAMVVFKKNGIKNVGGVELRRDLYEICQENLKKYNITPRLHLNEDACKVKDFSYFNTIFLFNPFPSNVMKIVVENLVNYFQKENKTCYVIYINPLHNTELQKANFKEITSFKAPISNFDVKLYRFQ